MQDDSGDLFRRSLWLAAGAAALGAVLMLRTKGAESGPAWLGWMALFLGVLVAAPAVETGHHKLDLSLISVSCAAAFLGLLLLVGGWLTGAISNDMLNLGPLFTLGGFLIGAIGTGMHLGGLVRDYLEESRLDAEADDADLSQGTKRCPNCGQTVPAYAGACRFCKAILDSPSP